MFTHDVEPAEVLDGGVHGGEHRVAVGHVQGKDKEPISVLVIEVLSGDGAGGGGHLVAALQRGESESTAQAAAGSRDEPGAGRDGIRGAHVRNSNGLRFTDSRRAVSSRSMTVAPSRCRVKTDRLV
ncbi:hypothetical protein GCM10020219_092320 [Nonomuraea dietziae]